MTHSPTASFLKVRGGGRPTCIKKIGKQIKKTLIINKLKKTRQSSIS